MLTRSKLSIYKSLVLFFVVFSLSCNKTDEGHSVIDPPIVTRAVNLSHFNHLYREINFKGKQAGIISIYSNYPNYEAVPSIEEAGITAVDDVARAIIVLSEYIKLYGSDADSLDKIKRYTEFILGMQNDNGYFNNFVYADLTINTSYTTSVARLDWWSLRALCGLETAYPLLKSNSEITARIELSIAKLLSNIKRDLPISNTTTEIINGIEVPTWLPARFASDQAALLIIGLLQHKERTGDATDKPLIDAMANGIMLLQKGDADNYPYGAFMSYNDLWHAYGNTQSYALLKAGNAFNNATYINSALKEINSFYPKLSNSGYAEAFTIRAVGSNFAEVSRKKYPQIAYGISPMVLATVEAYNYTKNASYLQQSKNIASWLSGANAAGTAIYNPANGICFDGIVSPSQVNKNSGAESTIESLLALLAIENAKK